MTENVRVPKYLNAYNKMLGTITNSFAYASRIAFYSSQKENKGLHQWQVKVKLVIALFVVTET